MMSGGCTLRMPRSFGMTIAQVSGVLWALFNVTANRVAKEEGFVRRVRRLTGASFLQGLVFGWLGDPGASVEQLAAGAAVAGAPVTPQALDQRLGTAAAAVFLK